MPVTRSPLRPLVPAVLGFILAWPLGAQELRRPSFEPADRAARTAQALEALAAVDQELNALRRVFVDSTVGLPAWIELQPEQVARTVPAPSPDEAVRSFLARYGNRLFGVGPGAADLDLVQRVEDGAFTHFKFRQLYRGVPVRGGELAVHTARAGSGHAVAVMNGRIYPDIDVATIPSLPFSVAGVRALEAVAGSRMVDTAESSVAVVPDGDGYRLAYAILVLDPGRGLLTRFVDALSGAVFAETPAAINAAPARASGGSPSPRTVRSELGPTADHGYVNASGIDALLNGQTFRVFHTGSVYQLRDDGHPGASEILIRDFLRDSLHQTACAGAFGYPTVQDTSTSWRLTTAGKEEVSAVHNAGESVSYFKNKFGRNGMFNNSAQLMACVHATAREFNAAYFPAQRTLGFVEETADYKPSAAAQDVVTHEFAHGVTDAEVDPEFGTNDGNAINEGLSDYFGARHRGSSCLAYDALGFCHRQINSDSTLPQRRQTCGTVHCLGIAFSSAVWRNASYAAVYGYDTDWGVYNGDRFYVSSSTGFATAREAVVRAAKDREHNNQNQGRIVQQLETEFYNRGIGPAPVEVSLNAACSRWDVAIAGSGTRSFALWFDAGGTLNQDPSASSPFDIRVLGTYTAATLPPSFMPSQVGGHFQGDGHSHDFRWRFTDVSVGYLDYYAGRDQGRCLPDPELRAAPPAAAPQEFAVRQAIQTPQGMLSSRVVGDSLTARLGLSGASLAGQVRAFGITALEIDVPAALADRRLELAIHNAQGQRVRRIVEESMPAGVRAVTWDGRLDSGDMAPPGVYVVVVRYGGLTRRTRFIVTRDQ